jgi:malate dehydrogenase
MRNWALGTTEGDWVSMAISSSGDYGAPEGIITSFPCTTHDGFYSVVTGLEIDEFSRVRIEASWAELVEERDAVADMGLLG